MDADSLRGHFWKLASPATDIHIDSVCSLISDLKQFKEDNDPEALEQEVTYTLQRLVKGLSSPREGARNGFTMALSELLLNFDVPIDRALEECDKQLNVNVSDKIYKRENCIGQMFFMVAICQSGLLPSCDTKYVAAIINKLFIIASKRSYLEVISAEILKEILSQLNSKKFRKFIWPEVESELKLGWSDCSLLRVVFVIQGSSIFPKCITEEFISNHWGGSIVNKDNLERIQFVIQQTVQHLPVIHPLLKMVAELLVADCQGMLHFMTLSSPLWTGENTDTSTRAATLMVFSFLLELCNRSQLKTVLSHTFVNNLVRVLSWRWKQGHPQPRLRLAANIFVENLTNIVSDPSTSSKKQLRIIKSLCDSSVKFKFDCRTSTKTVISCVSKLKPKAMRECLEWLRDAFINAGDGSEKHVDESRKPILALMMANKSYLSEDVGLCNFLAFYSYFIGPTANSSSPIFTEYPQPVPPLSDEIINLLDISLHKVLSLGLTSCPEIGYKFLTFAGQCICSEPEVQLRHNTVCDSKLWEELLTVAEGLYLGISNGKSPTRAVFEILVHFAVNILGNKSESVSVLPDLLVCAKKVATSASDPTNGEPHWVDVVSEILLTILSSDVPHTKTIVRHAFHQIVPEITPSTIQLLTAPLLSSGKDDDDVVKVDDSDVEGESGEDVYADDKDLGSSTPPPDEESSSDSESDSDSVDLDEQFASDVKNAMGESFAADESADDLNDEEMLKFDSAIAKVFKLKTTKSKEHKIKSKLLLDNFKLRLIDLIYTYIKDKSDNYLILYCLETLVKLLIEIEVDSHLYKKVVQTLGLFTCSKQFPHINGNTAAYDIGKSALFNCLHLGNKSLSPLTSNYLYEAALYLIKVLESSENPRDSVTNLLMTTLRTYMSGRLSHMKPKFFMDVVRKFPDLGFSLVPELTVSTSTASNPYRKIQAYTILHEIIKSNTISRCNQNQVQSRLKDFSNQIVTQLSTNLNDPSATPKPRLFTEILIIIDCLFVSPSFAEHIDSSQRSDLGEAVTVAMASCKQRYGGNDVPRKLIAMVKRVVEPTGVDSSSKDTDSSGNKPGSGEATAVNGVIGVDMEDEDQADKDDAGRIIVAMDDEVGEGDIIVAEIKSPKRIENKPKEEDMKIEELTMADPVSDAPAVTLVGASESETTLKETESILGGRETGNNDSGRETLTNGLVGSGGKEVPVAPKRRITNRGQPDVTEEVVGTVRRSKRRCVVIQRIKSSAD